MTAVQIKIMGWLHERYAPGELVRAEPVAHNSLRVTDRRGNVLYAVCRQDGTISLAPIEDAC